MSYIGTTKIGKLFLGTVEISKAYLGNDLVFKKGGTPLPYTPLSYIETDGVAYINTNIAGTPAKSAEIKVLPVTGQDSQTFLGSSGSTTDGEGKKFVMFYARQLSADNRYHLCGGYYYLISASTSPDVNNSVINGTPLIGKTSFKKGAQTISAKQEGESSFTSVSKTYSSTVSSTLKMYLLAENRNGSVVNKCQSGTRLYYCKIYSDSTYATLIFDGVPCLYNGEYGIWDRVSDSFFGNAANSGAFSGPSNS